LEFTPIEKRLREQILILSYKREFPDYPRSFVDYHVDLWMYEDMTNEELGEGIGGKEWKYIYKFLDDLENRPLLKTFIEYQLKKEEGMGFILRSDPMTPPKRIVDYDGKRMSDEQLQEYIFKYEEEMLSEL
jgi:hypothetical protein